jgi:integrase
VSSKVNISGRTFYEPKLRWKNGRAYIRFYNPNKRPKQKEHALHTTDKLAADVLFHEQRFEYLQGTYDPWREKRLQGVTLTKAIENYLKDPYLRETTIQAKRYRLEPFARQYPGMLVKGVTEEMLDGYCGRSELNSGTRLRYLYEFRRFLDFCKKRGWIGENPATTILENMPRHAKQEKRRVTEYLTPEEVGRILTAIESDVKKNPKRRARLILMDVIRFAVSTGLRRGEICRLRWEDVQLYDPPKVSTSGSPLFGWISVRRDGDKLTKTGDEDRVPLVGSSYDVLLQRRRNSDCNGYVFEGPKHRKRLDAEWVSKLFREYRRQSSLPERFRFHSLRHTCASWLAENSADLKLIQEVLRHSSIKQTLRYVHLMPDVVAEKAVRAMNGIVLAEIPPSNTLVSETKVAS